MWKRRFASSGSEDEMQNDECRMQNEEKTVASGNSSVHSAFSVHPSAFPSSHRLSGELRFAAVYDAKIKTSRGPLVMYSLPNDLGHLRMGISISRRVGTAPRRNRIKRLLREAFRLHRADLSRGYDLVIVVRAHVPMELAEYQKLFVQLLDKTQQSWK
jgi:ribonuclease P protein component